MRKIVIFILILGTVLGMISCSNDAQKGSEPAAVEQTTTESTSSKQAQASGDGSGSLLVRSDFKLAMFAGATLSGEEYGPALLKQQELTMMNIWTTTCPYCIEEMPMLEELSKEIISEGIQLIGVAADGSYAAEQAQNIIDTTGVTYLNIVPDKQTLKIISDIAYAVPTTIFVDGNGRIIGDAILGVRSKDEYRQLALQALGNL